MSKTVSKRELKVLGFPDMETYFNYILENQVKGDYLRFRELIAALSRKQMKEALKWALEGNHEGSLDKTINELINQL